MRIQVQQGVYRLGAVIVATNRAQSFKTLEAGLSEHSIVITNNIKDIIIKASNADTLLIDNFVSFLGYKDVIKYIYEYSRDISVPTYIIVDNINIIDIGELDSIMSLGDIQFINEKTMNSKVFTIYIRNRIKRYRKLIELEKLYLHTKNNVMDKTIQLIDSQVAIIMSLAELAESRDRVTGEHLEKVAEICGLIATNLHGTIYGDQINNGKICEIKTACRLHDIGKVGISDKILNKPDKLTAEERKRMEEHVVLGINIINKLIDHYPDNNYIETGLEILAFHHERWDGTGYPHGLSGYDIPLSARIMAVADVYDALRMERPYKKALKHEECVREILKGSGSHFDPVLVEVFAGIENEINELYKK